MRKDVWSWRFDMMGDEYLAARPVSRRKISLRIPGTSTSAAFLVLAGGLLLGGLRDNLRRGDHVA